MARSDKAQVCQQLGKPLTIALIVFISIAYYNVLELAVLAFTTFRSRRGLYFWSVLVSTTGIALNATGYLLMHFCLIRHKNIFATIILIGWCSMITGLSIVLYSRLHLVVNNVRCLRAVLLMIVINAIWLHIPVAVIVYGTNSSMEAAFLPAYKIYEKLQLTVFFAQECIISGLYIWYTAKLLELRHNMKNQRTRRVMNHLIYVNILVIVLDISILVLEYTDQFVIQTAWKPLVYSVKLKMEFSILNQLVDFTQSGKLNSSANHRPVRTLTSSSSFAEKQKLSQGHNRGLELDFGYTVSVVGGCDNQSYELETGNKVQPGNARAVAFERPNLIKTTDTTVYTGGPDSGSPRGPVVTSPLGEH